MDRSNFSTVKNPWLKLPKKCQCFFLVGHQTCPPTEHKMFSVTRSTFNGISCSQPVAVGENTVVSCLHALHTFVLQLPTSCPGIMPSVSGCRHSQSIRKGVARPDWSQAAWKYFSGWCCIIRSRGGDTFRASQELKCFSLCHFLCLMWCHSKETHETHLSWTRAIWDSESSYPVGKCFCFHNVSCAQMQIRVIGPLSEVWSDLWWGVLLV